ncbi:MAG: radical SAM protein [Candidatus Aenigmarchaeota archaeon]|nr:radical SAM protein [Candidatus Aenigmarchaeota archaeon]
MSKVVLFFPGENWSYGTDREFPPVSIISLGNYLTENGISCELVDVRHDDFTKVNLDDVIFVGISSFTGHQIEVGLTIAKHVRKINPSIPIVWGGIHPTLLPHQTLENPFVDIVVSGEGEETLLELARKLEKGESKKDVRGISYKTKTGAIKHNEKRPFMNMDDVSNVSFDLIKNPKIYKPTEVYHYMSSRGCPHRCVFCYNTKFCQSRWRTKSDKKVEEELKYIMDTYNPKIIEFCEDNFFVRKKKVENICNFLKSEGFSGEWTGDCRVDYFKSYDKDFLKLIKNSGCNVLSIGVESGSQRILDFVCKDITVKGAIDAAKKCKDVGISFFNLFMVGFPTETREEVHKTLNLIDILERINPESSSIISSFSPYPGTKLFDVAVSMGFKPPQSLEGWGKWLFSTKGNINWMSEEDVDFLEKVAMISRVRRVERKVPETVSELLKLAGKLPFSLSGNLRWRYRFFSLTYEWKLWNYIQRKRGYF